MRVLQITTDKGGASGVGTFVRELSASLASQGVATSVASAVDARLPRPDCLHIHGLWDLPLHRAAAWARRNGIPVIWSTHGMTAPWAMRHKRWKKLPAWALYQKRDLQAAAAIHCTSEQEVEWNAALGLANCFVAPLGTCFLKSGEDTASPRARIVLFVGRIYPVKGLANLVKAAALLRPSSDPAIRFRILGPDQAGHQAELMRLADQTGVGKMFEWVGAKFGAELEAEYANCDCLVLPSFSENFGAVVIDALAHGKPVLASRFTPWKVLDDENCGWWVENDPASLAAALEKIGAAAKATLEEMGERGRRLVERDYTWESVARRLAAAYARCLA